ncbi:glutamate receptor ionotropic, delta-1-like isoform X1 [Centruroides vittatus]|uniref:glutamate receptor ionotropic, delta-1-like isoform X1 n=1 Tax=Centruroides vittatus TaxID=120091 RepID=UPI003510666D
MIKVFYLNNSNSLAFFCPFVQLQTLGVKVQIFSTSSSENLRKFDKKRGFYFRINKSGVIKRIKLYKIGLENLQAKPLKVAVLPWDISMVIKMEGNKIIPQAGIDYNLLKVMASKLNFSYSLLIPKDKQWGVKKENGEWTGLIGMLQTKEADIALATLSITEERKKAVSFTFPYITQSVTFVTHSPQEKSKVLAVVRPFPLQLWIGVICTFIIFGLIIHSFIHLERKLSISRIYWYMFETLMLKGDSCYFIETRIRFMIISWFFAGLVLTASYSGILTSFMSLPGHYSPINSVAELKTALLQNRLQCGTMIGSAEYDSFVKSTSETMKTIGKYISKKGNSGSSITDLLTKTLEEDFALILDRVGTLAAINQFGEWKFHVSSDSFYSSSMAIALQQNSSFTEYFNEIIPKLLQAGLVKKWFNDHLLKVKMSAPIQQDKRVQCLRLDDVQAAFYILFTGYLLSLATLLGEIFCKHIITKSLNCSII